MRRELEWAEDDPEWAALLDSVVRRETDPATAARKLLEDRSMTEEAPEATEELTLAEVQAWAGVKLDEMGGATQRDASEVTARPA